MSKLTNEQEFHLNSALAAARNAVQMMEGLFEDSITPEEIDGDLRQIAIFCNNAFLSVEAAGVKQIEPQDCSYNPYVLSGWAGFIRDNERLQAKVATQQKRIQELERGLEKLQDE